jgi:DNA-binding response OmpR family regulator
MGGKSTPNRHILVVEDDRALRHVLSALLDRSRPSRRVRRRRARGADAHDDHPFDIVLLDVGLPSMSGLDVLARARALDAPPIAIMMTADDTSELLLEAVRRQAYRYIRKPFPPSAIVDVINEASARRRSCRSKSCRPGPSGSS